MIEFPVRPPEQVDTSLEKPGKRWGVFNAHDPAVFKVGDVYYTIATDAVTRDNEYGLPRAGGQLRRSKDLIEWEWIGSALDGVPKDAYEWTQAKGLWAPDVTRFGDKFYLYYCASQFGTQQSFIGVATSNSIEGPWTDLGEVLKTNADSIPNAIDPNIVFDRDGVPWMVYGSFFGGIYIQQIDSSTGKCVHDGYGHLLARRERVTRDGAIEGPYIVYQREQDMYYLFVSYDFLGSNYNVRVARSKQITGPYVDFNGNDMADIEQRPPEEIGTKILAGYQFEGHPGWMAPGHNSVLCDGDDYYLVHHVRRGDHRNRFCQHVRKLLWLENGWPVVSPERYAGEKEQLVSAQDVIGIWERIVFQPGRDEMEVSTQIRLERGGKVTSDTRTGTWILEGINDLVIHWKNEVDGEGITDTLKLLPAWDWELNRPALVFTGIDELGIVKWGKARSEKL